MENTKSKQALGFLGDHMTIGALRFENNFLAEKKKKLEAKLLQVRAQLERTSSAKLEEILSFQKSTSDRTGLGYDFSSSNIVSSSTTVFVSPANNVHSKNNECKTDIASENVDNGKSILGAHPKLEKKETRNLRTKKVNNKKSQPKKPHFCHHCGASGHTRPNYYKWLATQQSNRMISSENQNQFPSSFASLRDILKALMFLSNLNGFNSFPSPPEGSLEGKVLLSCGKKKAQSDLVTFSLSPLLFMHYLFVFAFLFLSQSSFMLCFV
ncbi:hypothetical protein SO802_026382 [Lithocarpus litseifolius]|uniref:CCHC-type domain-containing protein n=1 Tax=Lithocarpus litseifolius TaxID=425828 RepID=A0AAW2C231_9ROSI